MKSEDNNIDFEKDNLSRFLVPDEVPSVLRQIGWDGSYMTLFDGSVLQQIAYLSDISGGGGGTVTSVSVATANGFSGTVANATTTPEITISVTDSAITGKLLTGYTSGAGTITGTDTILQGIQKLNGNISGLSSVYLPIANPAYTGVLTTGTLSYSDTGILASFQSSVAGYNQIIAQNTNSGATASVSYLVSNNNGTANTNFGEFGMNSSGFTGSGSFNRASSVYLSATSGDLAIGTTTANSIRFVYNNSATDALLIGSTGIVSTNKITSTYTNVTSTTFTMSGGATTNGSNVITVTSTTGLQIGDGVSGTGIPLNAYVIGQITSTTFKISANATANNTGLTITVIPQLYGSKFQNTGVAQATSYNSAFVIQNNSTTLNNATLALVHNVANDIGVTNPAIRVFHQGSASGNTVLNILSVYDGNNNAEAFQLGVTNGGQVRFASANGAAFGAFSVSVGGGFVFLHDINSTASIKSGVFGNSSATFIGMQGNSGSWNPSSGATTYDFIKSNTTINQTGTATGAVNEFSVTATVTNLNSGVELNGYLFAPTITASSGTISAIRCSMATATGLWLINSTGTIKSRFGGDIELTGSAKITTYAGVTTEGNGVATVIKVLAPVVGASANIATTNIITAPSTGVYHVCVLGDVITGAGTISYVTITYTQGGVAKTQQDYNYFAFGTNSKVYVIKADSGTNISYATTIVGTLTYNLDISVLKIS